MDGSWPIITEPDLKQAIAHYTRDKAFMEEGKRAAVEVHIAKCAVELGREDLLPWNPQPVENWWDEALDRQVSLKPIDNCKFCRLMRDTSETKKVRPWMGTICNNCGKTRMSHRRQHPHMIDGGNKNNKWMLDENNCSGFEEPDLTLLSDQLDRLIEINS